VRNVQIEICLLEEERFKSSGGAFHIRRAETLRVRLPTVNSLNDGTGAGRA